MRFVRKTWKPARLLWITAVAVALCPAAAKTASGIRVGADAANSGTRREPEGQTAATPRPQEAQVVWTLREALRRALEGHPALPAAALAVQAAEAGVQQAGLRPNPTLGLDVENVSGDLAGARESETSLQLVTRVETGGKRDARLAVAAGGRVQADWDLRAARLDVIHDVRTDFVLSLTAQRNLALADETLAIAREVAVTARRKVEAGALPAVEAVRARVVVSSAEIERENARTAAEVARQRLALHWGGEPVPARVEGMLDSLPEVPDASALASRLVENPDLARWADELDLRRARVRLERSQRIPDLELGGGYRRLAAADRGTFFFGLSGDLPLRNRNQGAIRAAAADAGRGSFEQEQVRRGLERALRGQIARLGIAQAELRGLRRSVLPGAQEVYEGIRQGYEQGRFTYLDVLEARRFLAQAGQAEIAALGEVEQCRIEIERLIGRGFDGFDPAKEDKR